jgi:hypothetical protein
MLNLTSILFCIVLMIHVMVGSMVYGESGSGGVSASHMKAVAYDKASSAGCIARFSGSETDTKLRQIGTCENSDRVRVCIL